MSKEIKKQQEIKEATEAMKRGFDTVNDLEVRKQINRIIVGSAVTFEQLKSNLEDDKLVLTDDEAESFMNVASDKVIELVKQLPNE